jgi:hypothetical protein
VNNPFRGRMGEPGWDRLPSAGIPASLRQT